MEIVPSDWTIVFKKGERHNYILTKHTTLQNYPRVELSCPVRLLLSLNYSFHWIQTKAHLLWSLMLKFQDPPQHLLQLSSLPHPPTPPPFNPFTAMLAPPSFGKQPIKVPNLKSLKIFPLCMSTWKDFYLKHSIESGFVIGPSNILFAAVYACTFQPGNVTDWGSEGVKMPHYFL